MQDECVILIKAQPHRSSRYFETVCCAGIGRDRQWRRQYPVPFRILKDGQKFGRWQWVSYDFVRPKEDRRVESQKVLSKSLVAKGQMKRAERADFLAPLVFGSLREADERRASLTLVRPKSIRLQALKNRLVNWPVKLQNIANWLRSCHYWKRTRRSNPSHRVECNSNFIGLTKTELSIAKSAMIGKR